MTEWWLGTDESGGIANPGRPDIKPPPNWLLEAIVATERPRQSELSPDGSTLAFMLDRDTSDVCTIPVAGGQPRQVTVGRPLTTYWDDGNAVWSPDGSRLAYVQSGTVCVVAATGGARCPLVASGEADRLGFGDRCRGVDLELEPEVGLRRVACHAVTFPPAIAAGV